MNNEVLAIVAGKEITNADVDAFLANLPAEQRQYASNPYFREQYVEQVVTLHVLEKMADDLQLDMTDDYKKMLENIVRDIKARMAMNEIMKDITVTDVEAETVKDEITGRERRVVNIENKPEYVKDFSKQKLHFWNVYSLHFCEKGGIIYRI